MACPKCGSGDWKRASLVFAEGCTEVSTTTIGGGVGVDGDGVGVGGGVAGTSGEHQTILSKLAAPPTKPFNPGIITGIGVAFTIIILVTSLSAGWLILAGLLIAAGLVPETRDKYKREMESYRNDSLKYPKKKMCLRCGAFFFDDSQAPSPEPARPLIATPAPPTDGMKKCPFCAELIRAEAILCKHCHSKLSIS